jgi:hypothetical protein
MDDELVVVICLVVAAFGLWAIWTIGGPVYAAGTAAVALIAMVAFAPRHRHD